jgi:hypothetical protein
VLDSNLGYGHVWLPAKRLSWFLALILAPWILGSCGSSSSTSTASPSVIVTCDQITVQLGGQSTCNATVTNESSTLVNWSISPAGTGSISSSGSSTSTVYTAPTTFPSNNQNVITVTAASVVASTVTGTATITVEQPTTISAIACLDPVTSQPSTTVSSGNSLDCTATSSTGVAVSVNWTIANANKLGGNIGTIFPQGTPGTQSTYTAPLVPPPGQMVTITATSPTLSTNTLSTTVTVVFGNNILSGPYAFSTKGRVTNSTNAFFARAGIFTAGGGVLSGIEDTNQAGGSPGLCGTPVCVQMHFTGSYSIGPDGRGTMQFCENVNTGCTSGATAYFRIAVVSPSQAEMIDFSEPTTTSATVTSDGEMDLIPDTTIFNAGGLSGTYSFGFSGISSTSAEESVVGELLSNGFGTISTGNSTTPGEMDIDAAGPQFITGTTYSVSSNGRGTVTLNGLNFSFYLVTASHAKFMEIDSSPASILVGDAFKQQSSATCAWSLNTLNGATLFETSGTSSGIAVADLGSFTASNNGTTGSVGAGSIDENDGGTVPPPVLGTLTGSYTVDPCGRGTLSVGTHSYVFYPISTGSSVLQETTSGIVAHGFLVQPQGGPFTDSSLSGSYALNLTGTNAPGAPGNREDILGQLTSNGSGSISSGTLDTNSFGATSGSTGVPITSGTYLAAHAGASAAGALRATMNLSPTRSLVLYLVTNVSPAQFYVLDTDTTGIAIGALYNQF